MVRWKIPEISDWRGSLDREAKGPSESATSPAWARAVLRTERSSENSVESSEDTVRMAWRMPTRSSISLARRKPA